MSDNLNTHALGAFYLALDPGDVRRLTRKFSFVCTPKHDSWLSIAKIDLAMQGKLVLKKSIGDAQPLQTGSARCAGAQTRTLRRCAGSSTWARRARKCYECTLIWSVQIRWTDHQEWAGS